MLIVRVLVFRCIGDQKKLVRKAFKNNMIIPDFPGFVKRVEKLYNKCNKNKDGKVSQLFIDFKEDLCYAGIINESRDRSRKLFMYS